MCSNVTYIAHWSWKPCKTAGTSHSNFSVSCLRHECSGLDICFCQGPSLLSWVPHPMLPLSLGYLSCLWMLSSQSQRSYPTHRKCLLLLPQSNCLFICQDAVLPLCTSFMKSYLTPSPSSNKIAHTLPSPQGHYTLFFHSLDITGIFK